MPKIQEVAGELEFVDDRGIPTTLRGEDILNGETEQEIAEQLLEETQLHEKYMADDAAFELLKRVSQKLYKHDRPEVLTLGRLIKAYEALDALGGNGYECGRLMPLPKPVQPIRPRNERGEFVDRQGELRAEIRRLLDDPTVAASSLRERARTDAEFGRALDAELRPAGPAPAKANDKQIEQELRSFMWAYNHTADLKFYGGYSTLRYQDGTTKQFTREERDRKVNFAASLGIH